MTIGATAAQERGPSARRGARGRRRCGTVPGIVRDMRHRRFGWSGLLLIAGFCWASAARADILPEPSRPTDWDEHPAPTPDVPLEDALVRRLLPLLALGMAGGTAVAAMQRARTLASVRRG